MTLRRKTLGFILISVSLLVLALDLAVENFVVRGFRDAERAQMKDKVIAVKAIIQKVIGEFSDRFADWSAWDDPTQFMYDQNQGFLDTNISYGIFTDSIHVEFLCIVQASGEVKLAAMTDPEKKALKAPPEELMKLLTPEKDLMKGAKDNAPPFEGFLLLRDGPYIVTSRPLLNSDNSEGKVRGRIIIGKRIDEEWTKRIKGFTFLDISLSLLRDQASTEEERQARAALNAKEPAWVVASSEESMSGYAYLQDFYGEPSLLLKVSRDRSILTYGEEIVGSSVIALVLGGVLLAGVALLLMGRAVLSPLERLLGGVQSLEAGKRSQVTLSKKDELGSLAAAFNRMSDKILDREEALAQLLDNMRQAIVAFDANGVIVGRSSRRAQELFGKEQLKGVSVKELLFPEDPMEAAALEEWIGAVFAGSVASWEELSELAPRSAVLYAQSSKEVRLTLEFRPIQQGASLYRVMLLATDDTERYRLAQQQQAQETAHARQIAAMRRLLGGPHLFANFVRAAQERLSQLQETLTNAPLFSSSELELIFRHIHTIKGEARTFELSALESACTSLEDELTSLRSETQQKQSISSARASEVLQPTLTQIQEALRAAKQFFVDASPLGEAILDQSSVRWSDIEALGNATEKLASQTKSPLVEEIMSITGRLLARPFGEIASSFVENAPLWASEVGKKVRLELQGKELLVPVRLSRSLSGALTHLVKNSVAHGIEPPEVRRSSGKAEGGIIRLIAQTTPNGLMVAVEDDGRGIDREALRQRAQHINLPAKSDSAILFAQGASTTEEVNPLSGRGVGMAAARAELQAAGYDLQVDSKTGEGTRIIIKGVTWPPSI